MMNLEKKCSVSTKQTKHFFISIFLGQEYVLTFASFDLMAQENTDKYIFIDRNWIDYAKKLI